MDDGVVAVEGIAAAAEIVVFPIGGEQVIDVVVKLIAEAWDAGGLYQVGSFPSWNRWAEWNGRYRDDMRR